MSLQSIAPLRNPAHTGENRCLPCTALNAIVVVALATALWLTVDRLAGAAVLLVGSAAVWLRGYLVPGTPALSRRYLPKRLRRLFGAGSPGGEESTVDAERRLLEVCVLRQRSGQQLVLDSAFEEDWTRRMATFGRDTPTRDALATLFGVDAERLTVRQYGVAITAAVESTRLGQWESHAAFVADVAAGGALARTYPHWSRLDPRVRGDLVVALRQYLRRCPACEGKVVRDEAVVESCCRRDDVVAVRCAGCDARLLELALTDDFEAAVAA